MSSSFNIQALDAMYLGSRRAVSYLSDFASSTNAAENTEFMPSLTERSYTVDIKCIVKRASSRFIITLALARNEQQNTCSHSLPSPVRGTSRACPRLLTHWHGRKLRFRIFHLLLVREKSCSCGTNE